MKGLVNVLHGNACEPPPDYAGRSESQFSVANFANWNTQLIAQPTGSGTTTNILKTGVDSVHMTETATAVASASNHVFLTGTDTVSMSDAGSVNTAATGPPTLKKWAKRS
jgi:hypothetical protein